MSDFFKNAEKIAVKLINNVIGETVTYNLRPELTSVQIKGVFSNSHIEVNGVNITQPILRINGADITRTPSIRDTVIIDSITYRIEEIQTEDYGAYTLMIKGG